MRNKFLTKKATEKRYGNWAAYSFLWYLCLPKSGLPKALG